MRITTQASLLVLSLILTSCATPPPPPAHVFHKTPRPFLVLDSLDDQTCEIIQPAMPGKQSNDQALAAARKLYDHQTALVILENYKEAEPGSEFRDRTTMLYVGLSNAGYEHVVFLRGRGVNNPEGLSMIATY
jgi:hypothetical protein